MSEEQSGTAKEMPRKRSPRRRGRGPTVADVAREAGVSPMTVSRVLNGEQNVVAETRKKVEQAIKSLQYVPNPAARSLAAGRSCRIALVHSNPSVSYLSEMLMGCLAQAAKSNFELVVESSDPEWPIAELVNRIRSRRADAILLTPPLSDNAELLKALHDLHLPVAQITAGKAAAFTFAISIDDEAAAHSMTSHLIALGHTRIGFICGAKGHVASDARLRGYKRALREAGLGANPRYIVPGDFTYRSGLAASEALLSLAERPSAVFASNDDMAAAVVAMAHKLHIDVPSDLSVCGFDDTATATTIWPELTTIRQPIREMARAATLRLSEAVRAADGGVPASVTWLDFELVVRESTAPA